MQLTRDEFRKKFATARGREELGFSLTAEQAAGILADDSLTDSWFRKASRPDSEQQTSRPRPVRPAAASARQESGWERSFVRVRDSLKSATRWGIARILALTKRQRWVSAAVAGLVVLLVIAGVTTNNLVSANLAAVAAAEEDARLEAQAAEELAKMEAERLRDLEDARFDAEQLLESDADYMRAPPAWVDSSVVEKLTQAYEGLRIASSGDSTSSIQNAIGLYNAIKRTVGTEEEAIARQVAAVEAERAAEFSAAVRAADSEASANDGALVTTAKDFCKRVSDANAADHLSAVEMIFRAWRTEEIMAIPVFCPELQSVLDEASSAVGGGDKVVRASSDGDGIIAAGTYRTIRAVSDCYWERHTGSGDIIDNNFITHAPDGVTVTVYEGEGFSTSGCGLWLRVG